MDEHNIKKQLKQVLSPALYAHCAGVSSTAGVLATSLGCDVSKARVAGWLHDCAREWPSAKLLHHAQTNSIEVDAITLRSPVILHAPIGALLAQQWGVTDTDILAAIRTHTLGTPDMTLLAQIIYLADKIEPNRQYPCVDELRQLAKLDFHQALIQTTAHTISFILHKQQAIHPVSLSYWNWLINK
ncbi:MAG: bis(5'-nucleosyl)-tetraphosphatase (symmetrical) YqeK [Firmicutes bacterium]|nr:bis(5'-nucleosyl)-tetraphosphatase (symmetrical) YqeK [Bacillota bacterium]